MTNQLRDKLRGAEDPWDCNVVCVPVCQGRTREFYPRPTGALTPWKGGKIPKGREAGMMLSCVEGSRKKWLSMALTQHGPSSRVLPVQFCPSGVWSNVCGAKLRKRIYVEWGAWVNLERSVHWLPG